MLIKTLPVGMLETNCYIVTDEATLKCAVIDPGAESNTILDYIESNNLKPEAVLLTHGHFDHHMALDAVLDAFDVPVYIHGKEIDQYGQKSQYKIKHRSNMTAVSDGNIIVVGNLTFEVMDTPGHSPGSVTYMCTGPGEGHGQGALFTGDTLFCGDCGRTDLEGGDRDTILISLRRLAWLDGDFEVYPGHDESTTLDTERRTNMDMKIALGEAEGE